MAFSSPETSFGSFTHFLTRNSYITSAYSWCFKLAHRDTLINIEHVVAYLSKSVRIFFLDFLQPSQGSLPKPNWKHLMLYHFFRLLINYQSSGMHLVLLIYHKQKAPHFVCWIPHQYDHVSICILMFFVCKGRAFWRNCLFTWIYEGSETALNRW